MDRDERGVREWEGYGYRITCYTDGKYSGRTYPSLRTSSTLCPSLRGIIENFIDPTSSVRISPLLAASCRSSRILAATRLEVSAFDCKVLNTSAAVTASVFGRHES